MSYFPKVVLTDSTGNNTANIDSNGKLLSKSIINPNIKFLENFSTNAIDSVNFWSQATIGSGAVSVSNCVATLSVSTGGTDSAIIDTLQTFSCNDENKILIFSAWINLKNQSNSNNTRQFGAISVSETEGYFINITGTQLSVIVRKSGSDAPTNISNVLDSNYHLFEIRMIGQQQVFFIIDGIEVNSQIATSSVLVNDTTFSVYLKNVNIGAGSAVSMDISGITVTDEGGIVSVLTAKDENGKSKTLLCDKVGRIVTTFPAITGAPNNQLYYPATSIAPYIVNLWRKVITYNIPAGYVFNLLNFSAYSATANYASRITRDMYFGQYVIGTQTYSIGNTFANTDPQYAPTLEAEVTVIIATTVTLTITYINQSGTAGRTGTVIMTNADPVGTKRLVTLQAGDYGVKSVTAISRSGAATGTVQMRGIFELGYIYNTTANLPIQIPSFPTGLYVLGGIGGVINLEITASSVTAAVRQVTALHSLFLKGS
jgi:hypothetical protein